MHRSKPDRRVRKTTKVRSDEATNAAVLAFVDTDEDQPVRRRLVAALSAYEAAYAMCPACRGSGTLVNHSRYLYPEDGHRPSHEPIAVGAEISCVACDGHKFDLDQVQWLCVGDGYPCTADRPRAEDHADCGWRRRIESIDQSTTLDRA